MSLNKVMVFGRLGNDPEAKQIPSGTTVCNFSVATSEKYKGRDGNLKETTEWHKIVVWGKQAENCAKYLKKGRTVFVEGKLQTRSWDDNGSKRYATEIVASDVKFIGSDSKQTEQPQRTISDGF